MTREEALNLLDDLLVFSHEPTEQGRIALGMAIEALQMERKRGRWEIQNNEEYVSICRRSPLKTNTITIAVRVADG